MKKEALVEANLAFFFFRMPVLLRGQRMDLCFFFLRRIYSTCTEMYLDDKQREESSEAKAA